MEETILIPNVNQETRRSHLEYGDLRMEIDRLRKSGMGIEWEIDERRTLIEYTEGNSISSLNAFSPFIDHRLQFLRWMKRKLHEWNYRMRGRRSKWNVLISYPLRRIRCILQQKGSDERGERKEEEGQLRSFLETRNMISKSIDTKTLMLLSHMKVAHWRWLISVSWQRSPRFSWRNSRCMMGSDEWVQRMGLKR